jgi:hypothetical protein
MALTALALFSVRVPAFAETPAPTATPGARAGVPERVYDAGKIEQGTKLQHSFLIKNIGTAELSIDAKPG